MSDSPWGYKKATSSAHLSFFFFPIPLLLCLFSVSSFTQLFFQLFFRTQLFFHTQLFFLLGQLFFTLTLFYHHLHHQPPFPHVLPKSLRDAPLFGSIGVLSDPELEYHDMYLRVSLSECHAARITLNSDLHLDITPSVSLKTRFTHQGITSSVSLRKCHQQSHSYHPSHRTSRAPTRPKSQGL